MGRGSGSLEDVGRLMKPDLSFYKGKRIFITGHTGFKGTWLCRMLVNAGAEVTGYSLKGGGKPDLFELCGMPDRIRHNTGDIRDRAALKKAFDEAQPEIVVHLAAQPIVRSSYRDPAYTYETNVMGTVNLLECVRTGSGVKSFLNVTTDKVYRNREWAWGYRENEELDGYDPYSNSKSCSELVTASYKRCFLEEKRMAVSTARAGNVIGGGDFAPDRIIPDCVRAASEKKTLIVRSPFSVRPYQHVLEPLCAYLMIAAAQYEDGRYAGNYNVGPDEEDCLCTGELADLFAKYWGGDFQWTGGCFEGPHEANFLKLDCARLRSVFGWKPRWNLEQAVKKTVEWYQCWLDGGDTGACMDLQTEEFLRGDKD